MYLFFVHGCVWGGTHVEVRRHLADVVYHLPPRKFWGRITGHQAWWRVLLLSHLVHLGYSNINNSTIVLIYTIIIVIIIYPFIACVLSCFLELRNPGEQAFCVFMLMLTKCHLLVSCTPWMAARVWCSFSLIPGSQSKVGVVSLNSCCGS